MDSPSANGTQLSRRERLKLEREQRILDAAAVVFAQNGYHQTTIREIAQRADVADGTIYNYFDSKFDLLLAIMARLADLEKMPADLFAARDRDMHDFVVAAFAERMGRIERSEEMLQAILPQVFVHPSLRERFYQEYVLRIAMLLEPYIEGQIANGRIRSLDGQLVTRLVQGMFVGLLILRILGDEPLQACWDEVPELLATLLLDGLRAEEAA
ncbi:MAG: helix-turn-helix domain-containing protein [Anaerolineae bacterium]|jgi:AcrR family transcriptional regulator